jgi:hypothetical protein
VRTRILVRVISRFWMQTQRHHRLLVLLGAEADPAADLRSPQLAPVVLEQRAIEANWLP